MDVFLHTFLAVGSLATFFYVGQYLGRRYCIEEVTNEMVDHTLNMLESDGLIKIVTVDGEKEIVPISEIINDALKDAKT